MRTIYPSETLSFNDWIIYIHKENIRIRIQKLNHYEQNLGSKKSVSHYQRRIGQGTIGGGKLSQVSCAEVEND
jgi:hypothetical protein